MSKFINYIKKLSKKKKILLSIIILLLLVEVSSMFLMYKSILSKRSNLETVSLKNSNKSKDMFAIMLEQTDGTYLESDNNIWPTWNEDYDYNTEKSGCIDSNGNDLTGVLTYDDINNKISIKTQGQTYCYLYFDILEYDVKVMVSTDDKYGVLPTSAGYKAELTCNDSDATFNEKYQRVEIGSLTSDKARCNLTYTQTDTSGYTKLIDEVESTIGTHTSELADYTNATTLTESEYGTPTMYSATSYYATEGTEVTNAFTYSDTQWSSVPANLTSGTYYHLNVTVPEEGHYQLCYTAGSGSTSNRLYIYKNDILFPMSSYSYLSSSNSSTSSGCFDLGKFETSETIRIVQYAYSDDTYGIATMSFYLQKSDSVETIDSGYRYAGKTPDNYMWFNNEMWRIIGSVPTKQLDESTTNLVKIIREESIGGLAYDAKSSGYTGSWGRNTLYTLLNIYYYNAKDGTSSSGCYGYRNAGSLVCNYSNIGISKYYRNMVEVVYWNSGGNAALVGPTIKEYTNEIKNQTVYGPVGLMSTSDYGYASVSDYHFLILRYFPYFNWLSNQPYQWTLNMISSTGAAAININKVGAVSTNNGAEVRPVLYLNPEVYIISGTGAIDDPYIIGM